MKYNNIINGYIDDITEDMSSKQRKEVSCELETHILDSAEALAAQKKVEVDENIIREAIARMGPAEELAKMYPKKRTLLEDHDLQDIVVVAGKVVGAFALLMVILWIVAPNVIHDQLQIIINAFAVFTGIIILALIGITVKYIYETVYETHYEAKVEAKIRHLKRKVHDPTSPLKVGLNIIKIFAVIAIITVFWQWVQFPADFAKFGQLVPLFTSDFTNFIPYIILLGVLAIVVQLSYLVIRRKWMPSMLESIISAVAVLLLIWILLAFPFNNELTVYVVDFIKVVLALASVGCILNTVKKSWQTHQFIIQKNKEYI